MATDWHSVALGTFASRILTKNSESVGNTNVLTISAERGLVSQTHFFNKQVASDDLAHYFLLRHGDFAYNKSYSAGYPTGAIKRLAPCVRVVVASPSKAIWFRGEKATIDDQAVL